MFTRVCNVYVVCVCLCLKGIEIHDTTPNGRTLMLVCGREGGGMINVNILAS